MDPTRDVSLNSNNYNQYAFTMYYLRLKVQDVLIPELSEIITSYLIWYRGCEDFQNDHWLDIQDFRGKWYIGCVRQVDDCNDKILVHFNGLPSRWDVWVDTRSPKIQPLYTHTRPHNTIQTNPMEVVQK